MSDVKAAALRLVLRKRRTEKEVVEALTQKGFAIDEAEDAAAYYRNKGYIDHADYAKRYAHDAGLLKGYGPQRITRMLLERGVEEEYIEKALSEITFDVVPHMEQRFGTGARNAKELNHIFQYYFRRGFSSSAIKKALDELYTYE